MQRNGRHNEMKCQSMHVSRCANWPPQHCAIECLHFGSGAATCVSWQKLHQNNVPMQRIQTRARQQHVQLSTVLLCGACVYDVSYSDFSFALVQHVPLQVYLAFGELVVTWVCSWLFEWGQDILPPKPTVGPDLQLSCFLHNWEALWLPYPYWCTYTWR